MKWWHMMSSEGKKHSLQLSADMGFLLKRIAKLFENAQAAIGKAKKCG